MKMSDDSKQLGGFNNKTNQIEWSQTTYLSHLGSLIDSNMTYLHSTLSWAVTILVGSLGFILSRSSFPDHQSFIISLALLPILGHFAVRTGKAYLNVVRFGALEKHILLSFLENEDSDVWTENKVRILNYHCNWSSPLKLSSVIYKLLFELGFFYFFGITLGLLLYILITVGFSWCFIAEFLVSIFLLILEIWLGLLKSAYFRNFKPDKIAQEQR